MEIGALVSNARMSPKVVTGRHVIPKSDLVVHTWQPRTWQPSQPGLLFLHGGGFVYGNALSHRHFCALIAAQTGCKVYSVEYRLAPEYRYPAALEDVWEAWRWLSQLRSEMPQLHRNGLLLGGESAGGNLAAVLCQRLRDSELPLPDAQFLLVPITDLQLGYESVRRFGKGFLLTHKLMGWLIEQYQPPGMHLHSPDLSPVRAEDLSGLPPTLVALAGCDILLDQGRLYAERLVAAGVPTTLKVYPDMIHGFTYIMRCRGARKAALDVTGQLRLLMQLLMVHKPK
jgi:acetyl esterase